MRLVPIMIVCTLAFAVRGAELQFNFSDVPEGTLPTNFVSVLGGGGAAPKWQIVNTEVPSEFSAFGTNAPLVTPGKVLAQTSDDMTDERFPMCIYMGDIYRDFRFGTQFKIVNGISEQMAGIVFRFQNVSNYYYTRVSAAGKNVRFFKIVNGVRSNPIGVNVDLPAGEWHNLAVQCEGNHITILLDGRPALPTLFDNSFNEGRLGFWTKSDSVTYFSRPTLTFTPRVAPAQAAVNAVLVQQPKLLGLRIYLADTNGTSTHIIASKDVSEVGQPGTDDILDAMQNNKPFFGREHGAVNVTLPVRDCNGEIIAGMRVKMKSYFGETQDSAVILALAVRKILEEICTSAKDLEP